MTSIYPQKKDYLPLYDLAKLFGVGCKEIRQWLEALGLLKEQGGPTDKAIEGTYCDMFEDWGGRYGWWWHRKLIDELTEAGHIRLDQPLSKPVSIFGPFVPRLNGTGSYEIIGGDGNVAIWAVGQENAEFLVKLLNLAHKFGKV